MSLDQLYFSRPIPKYSNYKTPIKNLYLCGSGAHPGKDALLFEHATGNFKVVE